MTPNPNGVSQPPMLKLKRKNGPGNVEPRWGSEDFVRFFLGCAVVTATPGFVVKPRWDWVRMEKMWIRQGFTPVDRRFEDYAAATRI